MSNIEPRIIEANHEDFIVYFNNDGKPDYNMRWSGKIVEIYKYSDGTWAYHSDHSSDSTDKLEEARVWFEWSFVWRGVWEGRVYFKDEEYWSEEMETIPKLWEQIEAIVKEQIRVDNPDYKFFDV